MNSERSLLRSIGIAVFIILAVVIYAFGFMVTEVNFDQIRSEARITQLTRILRALAKPDIVEYEQAEVEITTPVYLPCPPGGAPAVSPDTSGPYLVLTPACGDARELIMVEGFNFLPGTRGPINFIPTSLANLTIGSFEVDENGYFELNVQLPNRQPVAEAQIIKAISRQNVGWPRFSDAAKSTFDKIVETVFLALLATTFGTLLAIPASFFAARNLMEEVKSPLTNISLSIIGWPLGIYLGLQAARWISELSMVAAENNLLAVVGVVAVPIAIFGLLQISLTQPGAEAANVSIRLVRVLAMIVAGGLGIFAFYLIAQLGMALGSFLEGQLGSLGFLGNFVFQLADILRTITPAVAALVGGGVLGNLAGRIGQVVIDSLNPGLVRTINLIVTALAGATVLALIGSIIDWFYQINNLQTTLWIPGGIGAILGIVLAVRAGPKESFQIGSSIYYVTRTVFNAIRSIEPLIMVIVFVVWVGIGPFAGALALGLHTIAALAKLFSEQVESILPGPLEAVQATGANRLQTIVYAVVPQIIPPYISFTMYRWDINVRMSTIIGFAGGGGIGFLLQQNIRLLNYRGASAQMLAIALVVASMDYISSLLRERFV
jgi:phosphonate ABC transporter permease subunit PhnE